MRPRSTPAPSSGKIARVLANLGSGKVRHWDKELARSTIRYHKIEGEIIRQFADEHHIGDVQIIVDNLARSVEENDAMKRTTKKSASIIPIR